MKPAKGPNYAGRYCFRYDDYQGNGYLIPAALAPGFDRMMTDLEALQSDAREAPLKVFFESFQQFEIGDSRSFSFADPREDVR